MNSRRQLLQWLSVGYVGSLCSSFSAPLFSTPKLPDVSYSVEPEHATLVAAAIEKIKPDVIVGQETIWVDCPICCCGIEVQLKWRT